MSSEELIVQLDDVKKYRERLSMYELYQKSLSQYIAWIKEQIEKSKKGYIRVKRGDLAIAMKKELSEIMGNKYRDRTFNSLYKIIRIVLFNEGIFAELSLYEDRERVFILRKRKEEDVLIPSLRDLEKKIKGGKYNGF